MVQAPTMVFRRLARGRHAPQTDTLSDLFRQMQQSPATAGTARLSPADKARLVFGGQDRAPTVYRVRSAAARRARILLQETLKLEKEDLSRAREKAWQAARLWQEHGLALSSSASPDVLPRIERLLRLAGHAPTISEEAQSAAMAAASLMQQHQVVLSALPPFVLRSRKVDP